MPKITKKQAREFLDNIKSLEQQALLLSKPDIKGIKLKYIELKN